MILSQPTRMNPTIEIPPWDPFEDHRTGISSPVLITNQPFGLNTTPAGAVGVDSFIDSFAAIHRYLPSNEFSSGESDMVFDDFDMPVDGFSCDHFRMFEFKIRRCARGRSHDWTECPYAHPGEKARRRDPRKYHYSGTACPEFRKGNCKKGDSCEFAHGIFECWLHPARYRTQACKDGVACRRRVCFFAHLPEQLRVLPLQQQSPRTPVSGDKVDGSRIALAFDSYFANGSLVTSPTSILSSPPESPPLSPNCPQLGGGSFNSINGLTASMKNLKLGKMNTSPQWGVHMLQGLRSPRGSSFCSVPSSPPTGNPISGLGKYDLWGKNYDEDPAMERVESGRDLRARMYAKLSRDNSVDQTGLTSSVPDVGWVSELIK